MVKRIKKLILKIVGNFISAIYVTRVGIKLFLIRKKIA